ncbi:MAG: hypothetical protein H6717_41575 [Polyangiaceae bacterium]|nr:hypothetical protein [Polyangiaceae bacterium]
MRLLPAIACAVSVGSAVLTGTGVAAAQSISSAEFKPPTADERVQLAAADKSVLPTDVQRDPARYAKSRVYWVGVTAGIRDGVPEVEHHYFDGAVEGNGGVWLSPWSEGKFCLLGLPRKLADRFHDEEPHLVRAYGTPEITKRGLCLKDAFVVVGDRPWTTTVLEYGPRGAEEFSATERRAVRTYPEARLLTPLSYRLTGGASVGKTNLDDSPIGGGWNASLELAWRSSLRTELAVMAGPDSYPKFGAPRTIQSALLFRYYAVGMGIAAGPLVGVPVADDEPLWLGVRYLPTFGDAHGTWGISPVIGGGADISATTDGDVRFKLNLVIGLDGNIGKPRAR